MGWVHGIRLPERLGRYNVSPSSAHEPCFRKARVEDSFSFFPLYGQKLLINTFLYHIFIFKINKIILIID